ncbi:histidine--tRNA ligase, partial [Streptomyces sp. SID10244]|nr:histidine--tRNA ligase [Streptomyces sp. SID10244]
RYDGLMSLLGAKQDLSGIGFGLGVDRTMLAMEAEGVAHADTARCQVYGVPLGGDAKAELVGVAGHLRAAGISVDLAYGDRGLKGAMKAADRSGARLALVLGDRELAERRIEVKDLSNGEQHQVSLDDITGEVLRLLG